MKRQPPSSDTPAGKRVLVFDFDGTLIDSNRLKYEAYFQIFPKDPRATEVIEEILKEIYEASRYEIIARIADRLEELGILTEPVETLAESYGRIVLQGAKDCPEIPGAQDLLVRLQERGVPVYLSSTTPEAPLEEIVRSRGWAGFFKQVFGWPRKKPETLEKIIAMEGAAPHETVVIGDGNSDRQSAQECGTHFIPVEKARLPIEEILRFASREG